MDSKTFEGFSSINCVAFLFFSLMDESQCSLFSYFLVGVFCLILVVPLGLHVHVFLFKKVFKFYFSEFFYLQPEVLFSLG